MFAVCAAGAAAQDDDLTAARAVFDQNIAAIRARDREKYLSLYLHSRLLIRTGPEGLTTGFNEFEKQAGSRWPDTIEASDIHLTELQPGYVYGTYRYRVRYGNEEHSGVSERLFVNTPGGWKIALTGAIDAPPGTPPPPKVITGATLIDGRGGAPIANAVIVTRDGKIDCAGKCDVPEGVDVIDAKGMWVTPGLIDAHVHFSQTGWADGRPDSIDMRATHPYEETVADLKAHPERIGHSWVCSGVTTVFDVGGYPWTLQLADRMRNDTSVPRVVAAGPLLSTRDHWLNVAAERQFIHLKDEEAGRSGVRYLASQNAKAIKVWYLEDNAAAIRAAGDEARQKKLPMIVHATELAKAKEALRAGATYLVHSVWDLPVDQEFIDLMKKNNAVLSPTLTVARGYVRMFQGALDRKAPSIDDPNGCVDAGTRAKVAETAIVPEGVVKADQVGTRDKRTTEREQLSATNLKTLVAAGIPIATGTDAGNPLTLHGPSIYAEMEAMQRAGMTPMQVIVSSTAVAARAAGVAAETGTIEKGKSADLVLLAGNPTKDVEAFRRVRHVMRAGVLRSIEDLSAMAK